MLLTGDLGLEGYVSSSVWGSLGADVVSGRKVGAGNTGPAEQQGKGNGGDMSPCSMSLCLFQILEGEGGQ